MFSICPQLRTHIYKDTAEPDPSISAAYSFLWDTAVRFLRMQLPALFLTAPALILSKQLPTAFQVLPQFGKAAVIMMPNISVRSAQSLRNLLKRMPFKEAQAQRLPLF